MLNRVPKLADLRPLACIRQLAEAGGEIVLKYV
jgi:hypothetical protein